jgi:hypothetical protein
MLPEGCLPDALGEAIVPPPVGGSVLVGEIVDRRVVPDVTVGHRPWVEAPGRHPTETVARHERAPVRLPRYGRDLLAESRVPESNDLPLIAPGRDLPKTKRAVLARAREELPVR